MFLIIFRIKLPIVSYYYINKICIYNFKLQEGITWLWGILFLLKMMMDAIDDYAIT